MIWTGILGSKMLGPVWVEFIKDCFSTMSYKRNHV